MPVNKRAAQRAATRVAPTRGNENWQPSNKKLWQRNYWEHIIRNEKSYYHTSKCSYFLIKIKSLWHTLILK
ncbi:MAG TPA: hypothetical protein ENH09_03290 [Bacteroidetes bacterium]|nr:hypothetical protein [Bacteroidota bacterium]